MKENMYEYGFARACWERDMDPRELRKIAQDVGVSPPGNAQQIPMSANSMPTRPSDWWENGKSRLSLGNAAGSLPAWLQALMHRGGQSGEMPHPSQTPDSTVLGPKVAQSNAVPPAASTNAVPARDPLRQPGLWESTMAKMRKMFSPSPSSVAGGHRQSINRVMHMMDDPNSQLEL